MEYKKNSDVFTVHILKNVLLTAARVVTVFMEVGAGGTSTPVSIITFNSSQNYYILQRMFFLQFIIQHIHFHKM